MRNMFFIKAILTVALLSSSCELDASYPKKDPPPDPTKEEPIARTVRERVAEFEKAEAAQKVPKSVGAATVTKTNPEPTSAPVGKPFVPRPLPPTPDKAKKEAAPVFDVAEKRLGEPTLLAPKDDAELLKATEAYKAEMRVPSNQSPEEQAKQQKELKESMAAFHSALEAEAKSKSKAEAEAKSKAEAEAKSKAEKELEAENLRRIGFSGGEIDYFMNKMNPETRTLDIQKTLPVILSDPGISKQIEEIYSTKEVKNLSQEQKALAASLGDIAIGMVDKMSPEEVEALSPEYRLRLFQIASSRARMLSKAEVSLERYVGLQASYAKGKGPRSEEKPPDLEMEKNTMVKQTQEEFAFSTDTREAKTPAETTIKYFDAVKIAHRKSQSVLEKLGSESDLHVNALTQIKKQIDGFSEKKHLTQPEEQTLEKYLTRYLDFYSISDSSDKQRKTLERQFKALKKQRPNEVKKFLQSREKEQIATAEKINALLAEDAAILKTDLGVKAQQKITELNVLLAGIDNVIEQKPGMDKVKELMVRRGAIQSEIDANVNFLHPPDAARSLQALKIKERQLRTALKAISKI